MENYSRSKDTPTTYVHAAFHFENFLSFFPPMKLEDGTYGFGFPQGNTPLAALAIADLGGIVNAIFSNPSVYIGKLKGAVAEDLEPAKYAEIITRVLGKTIHYNHISREFFASLGFPGAEDLATQFTCNRLHILERKADLKSSHEMYPEIKGFEQWLTENKAAFAPFFQEQLTSKV
ncbi:NmrA-like family protein [Kriegella aquimaris]|uniref:NmrA-like family protein n=2 Tax=Kriegella aquimaris TaxID=192904 RepID=A0A1G9RN35_9FLAO|nr:NmrA-like family protein [Kriegella aquimaris]